LTAAFENSLSIKTLIKERPARLRLMYLHDNDLSVANAVFSKIDIFNK
jgi:hypothetical protein